jgi:tyrosine-protein kinase Etk/Wzc
MSRYVNRQVTRQEVPAHVPDETEEKPLDVHELFNRFLRRKRLFIYIAIPIFLWFAISGLVRSYNPVYRATFDVGITQEGGSETVFPGSRLNEMPIVQIGAVTQRTITSLLSVNLANKVVNDLSLFARIEEFGSDLIIDAIPKQPLSESVGPYRIKIDEVESSAYRNGEHITDSIQGLVSVYKDGVKIAEGMIDEYIDIGVGDVRFSVSSKDVIGKSYVLKIYPKDKVSLALRNSLSIRVLEADKIEREFEDTEIPFSGEGVADHLVTAKSLFPGMNLIGILRIDVHWGNPHDALRIANSLSRQLLMEDRGEKLQQFTQSKAFIDSQLSRYQNNLTGLEEQVRRFKERKSISDLRASTQALIAQVSELESRKNQLQIEQNVLDDLIAYLATPEAFGDTVPSFAMTMLSDLVLRDFYSSLLQAEAELRGRLKEYSYSHPKVMEIKARLGGLKEQLNEEVLKRTSAVRSEISSYDIQIRTLQAKLDNVPLEEISLARLERDRETAEKLYTFFAEKLEETRVQEAGVTSDLKIINPPVVLSSPVNSRGRTKSLVIALVLAIITGTVAVVIADYVDTTVRDPEKMSRKLGIQLLETIPLVDDQKKNEFDRFVDETGLRRLYRRITGNKQDTNSPAESLTLLSTKNPSPEFESFRKLSVHLDLVHPSRAYHAIYLTSPGPEEGKTFVALNLGQVMGAMGKSVLMIDTDFRKVSGHLTEVIKLKKELGLFDILMGSVEPQDVVVPLAPRHEGSAVKGKTKVDLLPLGNVPPNPFMFLESDKMKTLLVNLRKEYDYLIIDGVPLLLFADATYLAAFADGVILTARYGRTTIKSLEVASNVLLAAKSDILGIILNGVPKERGSYYYDQYYRHYSKYYKSG